MQNYQKIRDPMKEPPVIRYLTTPKKDRGKMTSTMIKAENNMPKFNYKEFIKEKDPDYGWIRKLSDDDF